MAGCCVVRMVELQAVHRGVRVAVRAPLRLFIRYGLQQHLEGLNLAVHGADVEGSLAGVCSFAAVFFGR